MKRFSVLALALVCLTTARAADEPTIAALIGDRAPTAILRIIPDNTPPNQRLDSLTFVGGYQAIDPAVPLDAAQAARLAAMVKAPASFDSGQPEAKMRPGVAYRFGTGAEAIDILVCFSCDKAAFVSAGKDDAVATRHISQAARDVLLGLAKELLPKDEAIQELPKFRNEHPVPPPAVPVPADAPKQGESPATGGQ